VPVVTPVVSVVPVVLAEPPPAGAWAASACVAPISTSAIASDASTHSVLSLIIVFFAPFPK
jgi:hypothetical protein